jgi:hypothetical protein
MKLLLLVVLVSILASSGGAIYHRLFQRKATKAELELYRLRNR